MDLEINEAVLTGESKPVSKTVATLRKRNLPLGDRCDALADEDDGSRDA